MNIKILIVTAAVGAAVVACDKKEEDKLKQAAKDAGKAVEGAAKDAGQAVADAWKGLRDKAAASGDSTVTEIKKQIDDAAKKVDAMAEPVKASAKSALDTAKARMADSERALGDLKNATSENWQKLNEQLTRALDSTKAAMSDLMSKVK